MFTSGSASITKYLILPAYKKCASLLKISSFVSRYISARLVLDGLLALPGCWLLWQYASKGMTYGETVSLSGLWAMQLLLLTMAITPLRSILGQISWMAWLAKRRRDLGVAAFLYACLHTAVYFNRKADLDLILKEAGNVWLLAGWFTLLALLPLAVTSNDFAMRLLRRNWKRLHRLVYGCAILAFVHWTLSAFDPFLAYLHLIVLTTLQLLRYARPKRQRLR